MLAQVPWVLGPSFCCLAQPFPQLPQPLPWLKEVFAAPRDGLGTLSAVPSPAW